MPNKQEIWRPISLPVTSETHKLFFSNYVTDKVNGSRVQPSLGEEQRPDSRERRKSSLTEMVDNRLINFKLDQVFRLKWGLPFSLYENKCNKSTPTYVVYICRRCFLHPQLLIHTNKFRMPYDRKHTEWKWTTCSKPEMAEVSTCADVLPRCYQWESDWYKSDQ